MAKFAKGNQASVGNKGGGRPPSDVVALAKVHTQPAIDRLGKIVASAESRDRDVIAASEVLLNRAHGQPKQQIQVDMGGAAEEIRQLLAVITGEGGA